MPYRYFLFLSNFIDGKFEKPQSGNYVESFNPATGEVFAKVPNSNEEDVNLAVKAAKEAFVTWSETSVQYRSDMLLKIAANLESRIEEFVEKETKDQGKPVAAVREIEIPRCVSDLRFLATYILHATDESSYQKIPCDALNYVVRSPVGVAAIISPWNFPLYLLTWKIGPAIAFGNTCVCKPSELSSVTAWLLCDVMSDVGLPPGVVNMVFGHANEAIAKHPDISLISFTGGPTVGQYVQAVAAPLNKKISVEFRGKNAALIFDDVDMDLCVDSTIKSSFGNQGAISTSRIFVQRGVYEAFLEKFVAKMKDLNVGDPENPETFIGPLVSKKHYEEVKDCLELANETEGMEVHSWGDVSQMNLPDTHSNGFYIAPTVLTGMEDSSSFMQDEIFGPVTCVTPFDNEEEVIQRANDVQFGRFVSIWTKDGARVHRVSRKLNSGTVWVNCWLARNVCMPLGGVNLSGVGREGEHDPYDFYTEQKTICMRV